MPLSPQQLAPSTWQATDYGLLTHSFDPTNGATTATALTPAGTMWTSRLYLPKRSRVTNIVLYVIGAGATLTANQNGAALYNAAGTLLSNTAMTQNTSWQSTGSKVMPLLAAQDCPAGYYDVGWFYTGTTGPAMLRAPSATSAVHNMNLAGTTLRAATANTGLTTTFPATLGTKTAAAVVYWAALS